MKKKYATLLKAFIGLQVTVLFENGLCRIFASPNPAVGPLITIAGGTRMEIKEANDDYIVLATTRTVTSCSLHIVVFDFIQG
jgi:hypothetical protein